MPATKTARAKSTAAPQLTRAETCTTEGCTKPRIRLNALKCTEHEIVYRAAAKVRAAARKAEAAKAAGASPAKATAKRSAAAPRPAASPRPNSGGKLRTVRPPTREMGSGAVASAMVAEK